MTQIVPAPELDTEAMDAARTRWATRAKPPGALGELEDLAIHLAGITGSCPPSPPERPAVALFAGDHGVVADGASAWPSDITAAMAATIAAGGAAINAFARCIGADVTVIDVGIAGDRTPPGALDRRVRAGTASIARGPAMTAEEAERCVAIGREIAIELIGAGADCLIGGEMGIGNTTPSVAIVAACAGLDPAELVGPGAGEPAGGLTLKRRLVADALAHHRRRGSDDPIAVLADLGGLEIGALAGLYVEAAQRRVPFLVDGVIATAALCLADRLAPGSAAVAIAGHRSTEPAATAALHHLGLRPVLDLGLRLGEGTGAALAFPLVAAAARALAEMADLPEADATGPAPC